MVLPSEKIRFEKICRDVLMSNRNREGIGTLNEKRMHTMLKYFFCDDKSCHEVRIFPQTPQAASNDGNGKETSTVKEHIYVADILHDCDIYEIQTGHLYPLKQKIGFYLRETDFNVTVVHPLGQKRWVNFIDPESGKLIRRSHSTKKQLPRDIIPELYPLIPFLGNRRLHIKAIMLEIEDFKLMKQKSGHKTEKYESIPTGLLDAVSFDVPSDYSPYIPSSLRESFTASEFGKTAGYKGIDIYSALKVLVSLGLIRRDGMKARAALYRKV